MATTSTRGKNSRITSSLSWLLWQDTLLEWGIPVILISAISCFALLGAFEQIAHTTGVLALGGLLLLLVCFLLFKPILTSELKTRRQLFTWGLALSWLAVTCGQFYSSVFVGQEIMSSTMTTESGGIELSLGPPGTVYDLVVEGNFSTAAGGGGHEGGYMLRLEQDGQKLQELTGKFSETLASQRLGRRGRTTTRLLHNYNLHALISPGEGNYRLIVTHVDPQLNPTLHTSLYRDTYPQKTFWLLSVLLLIGAYIGETLHATLESPLILVTAAALTFVVTFHIIGVPPHSYQDIIGAFLVAALAGPVLGWLFRTLSDVIARTLGVSKTRRGVVAAGKGNREREKR